MFQTLAENSTRELSRNSHSAICVREHSTDLAFETLSRYKHLYMPEAQEYSRASYVALPFAVFKIQDTTLNIE